MKKSGILLLFFLISIWSSGQNIQTYYYGVNGRLTETEDEALMYQEVRRKNSNKASVKIYSRGRDGWIMTRSEHYGRSREGIRIVRYNEGTFFPRFYRREIKKTEPGYLFFTDRKGARTLRKGSSLTEIPLTLDGTVTVYYRDEKVASESEYSNNRLLSNSNWNHDGTPYIHNIFYSVSKPPAHPYGDTFIQNFITARMAEEKFPLHEVEDELLLGCVILENGELTGVRVLKGKVESVNQFFTSTLEKLPGKWNPAILEGDTVRYFITMPISLMNNAPLLQSVELTKGGQIFWND